MNLSLLRGRSGTCFVTTPAELAAALRASAGDGVATDADRNDFFFLDPELPRWKQLMSVAASG